MLYLRPILSALLTTLCRVAAALALVVCLAGLALYHLRPATGDWQVRLHIPVPLPLAQAFDAQAEHLLPATWDLLTPDTAPNGAAPVALHRLANAETITTPTPAARSPSSPSPPKEEAPRAQLVVPIGVAAAVDWITTPSVARMLAGTQWDTPYGPMRFEWDAATQTQTVGCTGCTIALPALGTNPVTLSQAQVSVQRQGQQLQGRLLAGQVQGHWQGALTRQQLQVHVAFEKQPLHEAFALFSAQIPEVQQAQIGGDFSLQADITLPGWHMQLTPQLDDFTVQGLGTEQLATAPNLCQKTDTQPIALDGFLARAVIAIEDQRFFSHPGYDLIEWQQSLQQNQGRESPRTQALRGASTLSQQLAKFMYTDSDRTPLRKLRELLYAVELEHTLGKAGILQQYLERVYWGEGICGAHSAAQHYFQQSVDSLNPAQAAWLAAMLHRPDYHAQRWKELGRIDVRRTQWVIDQLRIPAPQRFNARDRLRWQNYVASHDWQRSP